MDNVNKSIEEFSKSLLVTVFAIFAFAAGPLLSTNSVVVKVTFLLALSLSLASMWFGFSLSTAGINIVLNTPSGAKITPQDIAKKQIPIFQKQFNLTFLSLFSLIISVATHLFFAENYQTVEIRTKTCQNITNEKMLNTENKPGIILNTKSKISTCSNKTNSELPTPPYL